MKKSVLFGLLLALLFSIAAPGALAAEDDPTYRFELTCDGRDEKQVKTGDVITVALTLYRTDAEEPYTMYAMQDEISYNSEFFRLVDGSAMLSPGIATSDIAMRDEFRRFYMNYLSMSGGAQWSPKALVGSFQLEVIADSGVSKITNRDYLVSLRDGSASYVCEASDLTVILTSECIVHFDTRGGSAIPDMVAVYGETIKPPENPTREGMYFVGWYKDIDLKEAWNFETDIVESNMTLFAKWTDVAPEMPEAADDGTDNGMLWLLLLIPILLLLLLFLARKTVTFECGEGITIEPVKVFYGKLIAKPTDPVKEGAVFGGWYQNADGTEPWNFETDTVKANTTLYAHWL